MISTEHGLRSYNKTRHKASLQGWMRSFSRWKRVPRLGKKIKDTPHSYCWESHKNTKLHNHKTDVEDQAQTHTGSVGHPFKKKNLVFHLYIYYWFIVCNVLDLLSRLERHWWHWAVLRGIKVFRWHIQIEDQTEMHYFSIFVCFQVRL